MATESYNTVPQKKDAAADNVADKQFSNGKENRINKRRHNFLIFKNLTSVVTFEIFGKCGGGASFLVDGYRELNFEWLGGPQIQDLDFAQEPDLNRWDWGLNAGLGIGYRIGPGHLQIEYEYYRSLTDMNKFLTSKNRNAGFALGYLIRI